MLPEAVINVVILFISKIRQLFDFIKYKINYDYKNKKADICRLSFL